MLPGVPGPSLQPYLVAEMVAVDYRRRPTAEGDLMGTSDILRLHPRPGSCFREWVVIPVRLIETGRTKSRVLVACQTLWLLRHKSPSDEVAPYLPLR